MEAVPKYMQAHLDHLHTLIYFHHAPFSDAMNLFVSPKLLFFRIQIFCLNVTLLMQICQKMHCSCLLSLLIFWRNLETLLCIKTKENIIKNWCCRTIQIFGHLANTWISLKILLLPFSIWWLQMDYLSSNIYKVTWSWLTHIAIYLPFLHHNNMSQAEFEPGSVEYACWFHHRVHVS